MDVSATAAMMLVSVAGGFLGLAILRVMWIVVSDGDTGYELWRRRWIDAGMLVGAGVVLAVTGAMLG